MERRQGIQDRHTGAKMLLVEECGQRLNNRGWGRVLFPAQFPQGANRRVACQRAVWTTVAGSGRTGSCYGSEGWGFESLRARPGQRPGPVGARRAGRPAPGSPATVVLSEQLIEVAPDAFGGGTQYDPAPPSVPFPSAEALRTCARVSTSTGAKPRRRRFRSTMAAQTSRGTSATRTITRTIIATTHHA